MKHRGNFMDLKKSKKLKKKYDAFKVEYKRFVGIHVYRSENRNAPFSEWTRITETPLANDGKFNVKFTDEDKDKDFFYRYTEIDVHGNESEPQEPEKMRWLDKDGKTLDQKPEETIIGHNIYWSLDSELPLEQWTLYNERPIKEDGFVITAPVQGTYYVFFIAVNAFGDEFGKRSAIQKFTPENAIKL